MLTQTRAGVTYCMLRLLETRRCKNKLTIHPRVLVYTSGSRGGGPSSNGRGPMIFFMPKTLLFLNFLFACSLRSRFILSIILIEIWSEHAKNYFYFNLQPFQWFSSPPPPFPRWQSPPPLLPIRSNTRSGIHWYILSFPFSFFIW